MARSMTCEGWIQSFMLVDDEIGAGIGTDSTGLVGDGGHHFGVAPSAE